ncbi:MAG: LUD domain-containing protein [Candidatus Njordarchaeia archaeon]
MKREIKKVWKEYIRSARSCTVDSFFQLGLTRAVKSYREEMDEIFKLFPDTPALAEEAKKIKQYSIDHNEELLREAMESFKENGAYVYLAKTAQEAREIVRKIIGDGKIVVKSKSMVTEEIRLTRYLSEHGIEVWETDLGEFIIQLAKSRPMHIVAPAIHVPREKVAELFHKLTGEKVNKNNIEEMTNIARRFLREKYFNADVGISGANVVAAKEGAALIIENEGNAKLSISMPKKHIVVTGIEKIVPNLIDAMKVAITTWRHASSIITSYVNIVMGPSKSIVVGGEYRGLNGPEEVHIVFLDNGRSKMIKSEKFKQAAQCIRCGRCMYECPVFDLLAGNFGGPIYMAGIGTIWTAFTEGIDAAIPAAYTCLLDARCNVVCPININIADMILELRKIITRLDRGEPLSL